MAQDKDGQRLLEGAYDLSTPEDNIAYYREFAGNYDSEFAHSLGYIYPKALADLYIKTKGSNDTPIADIGCGTGLVAEALNMPPSEIDGIDISHEMLEVATSKNLYRALYCADLTETIEPLPKDYGAVLSAGTFTHGHLGPEPLITLLSLVRPGALFCIGVNQAHFDTAGFGNVLSEMQNSGLITRPQIDVVKIYEDGNHDHSRDKALLMLYRKA